MKTRNPIATQTLGEKQKQYFTDSTNGTWAYKSDGSKVLLSQTNFEDVEFIGGLWRVQEYADYNIRKIRDRDMIIGKRLEHNEKTFFEYYQASVLTYNCYGVLKPHFDMVAAKYVTDKGEYWSYGKNIAAARAFLGIRLYDEYMELIHANACKNNLQNTRK